MWLLNEDKKLSDDDLRELVLESMPNSGIFFLDGPSGCGKTRFVKSLPEETTIITGFNVLYEYFTDAVQHGADAFMECHKQLVQIYRNKGEILCFEDVDIVLLGRPSTQAEFARIVGKMAQSRIVILTGIEIDKRCRTFVERLSPCNYCKWSVEESRNTRYRYKQARRK